MDSIMRAVEATMPWQPAFVSITDHARDRGLASGAPATRPRPGTLGTAVAIRDHFDIATMPHLIASGANRLDTEDLLIDLHWSGFHDLFVVRGDEPMEGGTTSPRSGADSGAGTEGYAGALDLVRHIGALNAGSYSPPIQGKPTSFTVGVAGYPEKHNLAASLATDMDALAAKLDAGAAFVITQMVFDAEYYRRFVRELRKRGHTTPVIPGLKPILRRSSLELIPSSFFVEIPKDLIRSMEEARSPEEERRVGKEWAVRIAEDLLDAGAPCIQYFTMGRGDALRDILRATFG